MPLFYLIIFVIVLSSKLSALTILIWDFLNLTRKYPASSRMDLCLLRLLFLLTPLAPAAPVFLLLCECDWEAPILLSGGRSED